MTYIRKAILCEKNKKGFTLIEIIAVLAILAILAAVAIPVFFNIREEVDRGMAETNVRTLKVAVYCAASGLDVTKLDGYFFPIPDHLEDSAKHADAKTFNQRLKTLLTTEELMHFALHFGNKSTNNDISILWEDDQSVIFYYPDISNKNKYYTFIGGVLQ